MGRRLVLVLTLAVAAVLGLLRPRASLSAPAAQSTVPDAATRAMREGRFLRASLVLRDYLGATGDSTAAALLLSAQAEAGWGDWERVQHLLSGRRWLDTLAAGQGWELLGRSQLELGQWQESQSSYERFLAVSDTDANRELGLAQVRRAQAQIESGAYADAIASYHGALSNLPQITDWIHLFAASAAASAGDTLTVDTELADADAAVRADWGWRARLRARQNADALWSALAIADSIGRSRRAGATRAEASNRAGELRLLLNDSAGARAAFLRALTMGPGTAYALASARTLSSLPQASASDHRLIADVRLRQGDVAGALASYRVFLERGDPTPGERLTILETTGQALFTAGRYAQAESRLLAYADSSHVPERAAGALYTVARAQYRDGREPVAVGTLRSVIKRFPTTRAAADAAYLLADLAHDAGDLSQARERYHDATVLAPSAAPAGLARMRLAGMAFLAGNYQSALDQYQAYLAAFPNGQRAEQARYWAALSLLELHRTAEANTQLQQLRAADPFSYYSLRAADRLGDSFWNATMEPSPERISTQEGNIARALARLELLREIGWDDAANFELNTARRHFAQWDGAVYSLAEGLIQRGYASTGISLAWDLHRREGAWNIRLLRILYPFPYQQIVLAEAADRSVDPFLAAGLIRQESMFNPSAVSRAGAVGLMQIMPATGRTLARKLGVRQFRTDLLKQPDVNVHLGMAYLADQLEAWNGRIVPVLAAYNAGPTRVERWRSFPEWGRDELFTERIPYQETRDYVRIVQRNAAMYRALYGTVATEQGGD